jgi:hypothetical protein
MNWSAFGGLDNSALSGIGQDVDRKLVALGIVL